MSTFHRSMILSQKLMIQPMANRPKCIIIYATETGRSLFFAEKVHAVFKKIFNAKLLNMNSCTPDDLQGQQLIICVTSTFGNGDPPNNAKVCAY